MYEWYENYKAAVLETEWSKMEQRIEAAEAAIRQREHDLSLDHGGTPEERQAIADALNGLNVLRQDAISWSRANVAKLKRTDGDNSLGDQRHVADESAL